MVVTTSLGIRGTASAVRGSIVDVTFTERLPDIRDLIELGDEALGEVSSHRNRSTVRCLAMTPTQGLARGDPAVSRHQPITVPVGEWEDLLTGLLRQDLFIALYRAVAEAKAAEHGARLAAMQAAEQNIEERLDQLRNEYHQLRQAEITEQLLDVVSGFEALRDE